MSFFENLEKNINAENSLGYTENGALGFTTTGKTILDMNFRVPKYRTAPERDIAYDFNQAHYENPTLALLWLFYARDCRGGLGERRLFRTILKDRCQRNAKEMKPLLKLVPEYGRWDDLIYATDCTELWDTTISLIREQLDKDLSDMSANKPVSLLAKWLPSSNTSSADTKKLAMKIARGLGMQVNQYRKTLSKLRAYIKVVEVQMSANEWSDIDYSAVPSYANLRYKNAFMKHDEARRQEYLDSLVNGETKINASVAFPHDIVHKYSDHSSWSQRISDYDETLEQMWKALPTATDLANTIVVADGSGSMTSNVGGTNVTALDVANALAIYCAERNSGEFHNKYITFSENPKFVDLSPADSLRDKLEIAYRHNECANTNIEAVFDMILDTAVQTHAKQDEIPANILIISDMEFDNCVCTNRPCRSYNGDRKSVNDTLFEQIRQKYADAGYKLPRLVFWNVCSRTSVIPVKENELGVALVSGFSTSILNMVMSGELDPFKCLINILMVERYKPVMDAIASVAEQ